MSRDRDVELDLVARAREGDSGAFRELVAPHRDHLWAGCLSITSHRQDAEDALQDALIAGWRNLERFEGHARFSTWMHRIAANAALMLVRKRRDTPDADAGDDEVDRAPGVSERVTTVDVVRSALATLPPEFREAVVLREYADFTYQDIADHQGVAVATVKTRLNRGRAKLKAALVEAGIG